MTDSSVKVRLLDKTVAERIAAGEVVDKPASVVKELLENALDASSSRITVQIRNGGKTFIRVTDDGCGMSAEDLKMAVKRFATSKISQWEDLDSLYTLGFRGEALPSIAAVSRLEIKTSLQNSCEGSVLTMEGPEEPSVSAAPAVPGTSITVRELFFNTPARLKFLRTSAAEAAQIIELAGRIAAAWPEIAFKLISNDKEVFNFTSDMGAEKRLARLWKMNPEDFVPVFGSFEGISIDGFIAKPQFSKTTRSYQLFVMNGRIIKSQHLSQALAEGFSPLIEHGRFPIGMIRLTVDPAFVDVNVHPTKLEVRFADPKPVFSAVYTIVSRTLEDVRADSVLPKHFEYLAERVHKDAHKEDAALHCSFEREETQDVPFPTKSFEKTADLYAPSAYKLKQDERKLCVQEESEPEEACIEAFTPKIMSLPAEKIAAEPAAELSLPDKKTIYAEQASFLEQEDFAAEVSEFKVLGQVYNTFIAGIMDGKFWLVDQHTAQERINYENLGRIKVLSERSQQLLIPEIIDMSLSAMEFLETYSELFSDYGYDIEVFGSSQIALRGVPAALPFKRAASIFKELAEELSEGRVSVNQNVSAALKERIRAMASCKAAVKAGDPLSIEAMTRLVNDMLKVEHSRYCPHGRPTRIILEEHVLERLFHRA